jgi:fructokinase
MNKTPFIFGEVLFDCFPDGSKVLGGAPFNVAWHLKAFGCSPLLISRVGNDAKGKAIRDTMDEWNMPADFIQTDRLHPTGVVNVTFFNGEPSYDIVKDSAWDFIDKDEITKNMEIGRDLNNSAFNKPYLYHGSLALRNSQSLEALKMTQKRLKRDSETNAPTVFLDINLRPPHYSSQLIARLFDTANRIKLNDDELNEIFQMICKNPPDKVYDETMKVHSIMKLYSLKSLLLTKGSKGAILHMKDGKSFSVEPEENVTVIDTVGAGDGFTSIVILGDLMGWNYETTLSRAQSFAAKIVGQKGATTTDRNFYEPFIIDWKLNES